MIHGLAGGKPTSSPQAYDAHGRYISAIDRHSLNTRLLNHLSKMPNVKLIFNHKLTGADFNAKEAWFEVKHPGKKSPGSRVPEIEVSFDFLIGADGAHSAVRFHMMKFAQMNFSQEYIDTLWCEFTIPPAPGNDFAISPNHLHIWPAGTFMFIAIPSLDRSFTCTLFAPTAVFTELSAAKSSALEEFFNKHFPGVVPDLISAPELRFQYHNNPHLPLVNIKTAPHHFSSSVVILGDAANAIVPFYGQGMNAGLESVRVLFDLLDSHGVYADSAESKTQNVEERRAEALAAYTAQRVPDAHCIADLALDNYVEMRDSVRSPLYRTRKLVEEALDRFVPWLGWSTQYSRVSFGNERYSEVAKQTARQGFRLGIVGAGSTLVLVALAIREFGSRRRS